MRYESAGRFWRRHTRAILWGIAIAGILIGVFTGFRFTLLFLPLVFVPDVIGRRDR